MKIIYEKNNVVIDNIISESIKELNLLIPDKKKINPNKFYIEKNDVFDSLNYITFLISLEKQFKKISKKSINLSNRDKIFKNREDLKKFLIQNI